MGDPAISAGGFREFLDRVKRHGLEWLGLYYGIYRARVVDNSGPSDKQNQGIITVRVPAVGDSPTTSPRVAYPMVPFAGKNYGAKFLPKTDDFVWVVFEGGRVDTPVWMGGWWAKDELPEEMHKTTSHGFKTPGGHSVLFSDDPDNRLVRITWHNDGSGAKHSISMTEDALTLADKDGNVITIDKGAITIMSAGDVTVRGPTVNIDAGSILLGGNPATFKGVLGELLMTWLTSHVHGTGVGPSSPPVTPPPSTILSENVKLMK